jgi:hypothetical protein
LITSVDFGTANKSQGDYKASPDPAMLTYLVFKNALHTINATSLGLHARV